MQLAIVAAGFTPGEADELRRSMAAWKKSIDRGNHAVERVDAIQIAICHQRMQYGRRVGHAAGFDYDALEWRHCALCAHHRPVQCSVYDMSGAADSRASASCGADASSFAAEAPVLIALAISASRASRRVIMAAGMGRPPK